jgi:hypothetical protein
MPVLKPGDIACLKNKFYKSSVENPILIEIIARSNTKPGLFLVRDLASCDYLINKNYNLYPDAFIKITTKDLILYTNLQHKSERFWELLKGSSDA